MRNTYTLNDLIRAIYGNVAESNQTTENSDTSNIREQRKNSVGNIYTEDSINEALRANENDVLELQRQIDAKNRANEALRIRLNNIKNQTKLVKNGSNVAVTMARENLMDLFNTIGNLLKDSDAERLTFTLENVN